MRRAVITGSFDPVTSGHLDLIRRAADIFDEVYAVILFNAEKKSGMFSPEDRLKLLKCAISELGENVHAVGFVVVRVKREISLPCVTVFLRR